MARRRDLNLFGMSFLDCICCGFGAIILLYVIVNARATATRAEVVADRSAEIARLEFEVLKGRKNLTEVRNAIDETDEELVRTEGRSREILAEIAAMEVELAEHERETLATVEHVNDLKTDIESLEEEIRRLSAAVEADREGQKLIEFKGEGDRHYLTGLRVGGERVLILVDSSASMLSETILGTIRLRNAGDEDKKRADKWVQTVRTVEWLTSQLPKSGEFQVFTFGEQAGPLRPETAGSWLDAGDPDTLGETVEAMRGLVPGGGTSLLNAFESIGSLPSLPDNVILLTDGLPTMAASRPSGHTVSSRNRFRAFERAVRALPDGVPVNVILYPMEGDPIAASAFWRLAIDTRGSYFCPAGDWP